MALKSTSLFIQASPLPATFQGSPQDLFVAMVERMKIMSPNGTNFIFIGSTEPTSNVGPWLKDGTSWYVWDVVTSRYVPADVSASVSIPFWIGASTPGSSDPPVWLRTTADATDINGTHGLPLGWYLWDGTTWQPYVGITPSGPTASRPVTPIPFQQYYDTDINCLIWFERSAWRTVSGVVGDIKAVSALSLSAALTQNPGWALFADTTLNYRGRYITQATQDGTTVLPLSTGVPARTAGSVFGAVDGIKVDATSTLLEAPGLALWHLVKT